MAEIGEISKGAGYLFRKNKMDFYEFHVDDHPSFQSACKDLPYGGMSSIRKPDRSCPLVPKDEGMGLIISAFTSRELGFGYSRVSIHSSIRIWCK